MLWLFLLGPPLSIVLALTFGGLQWAFYRALVGMRLMKKVSTPPFIFLFFRGFLGVLALILMATIWSKQGMEFWEDPTLTPEAQEGFRKHLDPEYREQIEAERRKAFEEKTAAEPPAVVPQQ